MSEQPRPLPWVRSIPPKPLSAVRFEEGVGQNFIVQEPFVPRQIGRRDERPEEIEMPPEPIIDDNEAEEDPLMALVIEADAAEEMEMEGPSTSHKRGRPIDLDADDEGDIPSLQASKRPRPATAPSPVPPRAPVRPTHRRAQPLSIDDDEPLAPVSRQRTQSPAPAPVEPEQGRKRLWEDVRESNVHQRPSKRAPHEVQEIPSSARVEEVSAAGDDWRQPREQRKASWQVVSRDRQSGEDDGALVASWPERQNEGLGRVLTLKEYGNIWKWYLKRLTVLPFFEIPELEEEEEPDASAEPKSAEEAPGWTSRLLSFIWKSPVQAKTQEPLVRSEAPVGWMEFFGVKSKESFRPPHEWIEFGPGADPQSKRLTVIDTDLTDAAALSAGAQLRAYRRVRGYSDPLPPSIGDKWYRSINKIRQLEDLEFVLGHFSLQPMDGYSPVTQVVDYYFSARSPYVRALEHADRSYPSYERTKESQNLKKAMSMAAVNSPAWKRAVTALVIAERRYLQAKQRVVDKRLAELAGPPITHLAAASTISNILLNVVPHQLEADDYPPVGFAKYLNSRENFRLFGVRLPVFSAVWKVFGIIDAIFYDTAAKHFVLTKIHLSKVDRDSLEEVAKSTDPTKFGREGSPFHFTVRDRANRYALELQIYRKLFEDIYRLRVGALEIAHIYGNSNGKEYHKCTVHKVSTFNSVRTIFDFYNTNRVSYVTEDPEDADDVYASDDEI